MRASAIRIGIVAVAVAVNSCGGSSSDRARLSSSLSSPSQAAPRVNPAPSSAVPIRCGIEMRNVALHIADGVVLEVRVLVGEFVSRTPGAPPAFDDPQSYTLRVRAADLAMDAASLTNLLRKRALGSRTSPVQNLQISIEDGLLHARGKLQKGVPVPFSMIAAVSAAADGSMRLHATKLKAVGVPVKGLLDLFGVDLEDLMKMPSGSGVRADGEDLLIDVAAMLPPPHTEGRLQRAGVAGKRLTMEMTGPASPPVRPATLPLPTARNYLYFFGGSVRFGKLTMSDADMQLIDADPRDAFDFFPAHYDAQLVAGYSRNTSRKGLQVFMPDYWRVQSNRRKLKPPPILSKGDADWGRAGARIRSAPSRGGCTAGARRS